MNRIPLLAGTVLLGCAALAANAAEPMDGRTGMRNPFPIDIATAEAQVSERFAKLDADGDGKVTREEFAKGTPDGPGMMGGAGPHGRHRAGGMRMWHAGPGMDAPEGADDGAPGAAMRGTFEARMAELDPVIFKQLDTDGNGALSSEEFSMDKVHAAAQTTMRDAMFERLDKNSDGVLTKDEAPDAVDRLRRMDANADGTVTRDEARAYRTKSD